MSNSYSLKCDKCHKAQQILYEADNYDVAEAIGAEFGFDFEPIDTNDLIKWLNKHSKHSKITFLISC